VIENSVFFLVEERAEEGCLGGTDELPTTSRDFPTTSQSNQKSKNNT
jgi:hypothetical protein